MPTEPVGPLVPDPALPEGPIAPPEPATPVEPAQEPELPHPTTPDEVPQPEGRLAGGVIQGLLR